LAGYPSGAPLPAHFPGKQLAPQYLRSLPTGATLHWVKDEPQFEGMVAEMWRVLGSGGIFFARLASTKGIENRVRCLDRRWHRLPDGTDRSLIDDEYLWRITSHLGGELPDPIKTTIVQSLRAMTAWFAGKDRAG